MARVVLVVVPADVAMPECCCACGADTDVHLVARRLTDGVRTWRGRLPYCTQCEWQETSRRRRWHWSFAVGLPALVVVMWMVFVRSRDTARVVGQVIGWLFLPAVLVWWAGPFPIRKPVRLYSKHKNTVTFGLANHRFAAALLKQPGAEKR